MSQSVRFHAARSDFHAALLSTVLTTNPAGVVVTAEPTPSRLASLALGTGDIDCVYHFALYELQQTLQALAYHDAQDLLEIMVSGKRLKDISDLPLDLAI